ncbi:MAG TPA: TspO/MBR family protein [Jatrophihabitans sp.]|jgi:tryptophan-rich sensory protein|uniref:TspO/MBR family protein n=1 Tax=Jatrophihabitans sp. TaxID=1932789 RepID=UPI002E08A5BB|nr:TspO/MBR family protein [Jatrophihabitans sp.]
MNRPARALTAAAPPVVAAAVGATAARNAPEIYARLDKPSWAPPAGVFGPVWSALYLLIGATGWRLAERPRRVATALHLVQLGLNASWTPLFFGAGRRRAALAVSIALDVTVAAEMAQLVRDGDRPAAALLAPYLAWCGFATALTASVGDPQPAGEDTAA